LKKPYYAIVPQVISERTILLIASASLFRIRMASDPTQFDAQLQAALDSKTKPVGSLGKMESLAAKIAQIHGSLEPRIDTCALVIFAGDHGMARAGVSAFPQDVTRQMVQNFLVEGAAANVFAQSVGATVKVVDAGVAGTPVEHVNLINHRMADGTQNAIEKPAMTGEQLERSISTGMDIGHSIQADVACFGEMGIGNTSSASLIASKVLNRPILDLTGRGTGLDDEGLQRKQTLLQKAAARTPPHLAAKTALQEYGGFEISMMAGAMIGAAGSGRVVVVDGFIATAAALCAHHIQQGCERNFVFAHQSAEAGHRIILEALDARPLLNLDVRLGEGTGPLLAFPLIMAAAGVTSDKENI